MSTNRFLTFLDGAQRLVSAIVSSTGSPDANKIVATGNDGRLSMTLMPTGVGAQTQAILASENLAAGDFVNIFNDSGTPKARKADASNGRFANGFVLSVVNADQSGIVYSSGFNTALTGLTPGARYFLSSATPGAVTTTAPAATAIVQTLGVALSSTNLLFEFDSPIEQE